jgi:TonB-dependent receptor
MHSSSSQFRRVVPFILCLLLAQNAHAQVAVRGEVTDATTSRPLAFAEVTVAETNRSVAAGANGAYTVSNLAPGTYTLTVSSVGYQPLEKTVEVTAAGAATLDFAVEAVGVTEEIVVTGFRAATANALQDKRMSAMIKEAITADDAGKLPDQNIAEALRRVTGVTATVDQGEGRYVTIRGVDSSYTNVTVDNQVIGSPEDNRSIALDTIPSEVLSRVEVVKAVTPDMDGNAVGGAINIITPSAFDDPEGFFASASADFGYYDLNGKNPAGLSAAWGQVFGANDEWGIVLSASYSDREYDTENLQGGDPWDDPGEDTGFLVPDEQVLRDYRITRERSGIVANLEWQPTDSAKLYFRNLFNNYEDTEVQAETIWAYREGDLENLTPSSGTFTEGEGERLISNRYEKQTIRTSSIGGEFTVGNWGIDAQVTLGEAKQDTPEDREWSFELSETQPMSYDTSNLFWQVEASDPAAFNDPSLYEFNEYLRGSQVIVEDVTALEIDLERDIAIGGTAFLLKFGAKSTDRDKSSDQDMEVFDGYEDDLTLEGFTEPGKSDFYDSVRSGYDFGPRILFPEIDGFYEANAGGFELSDADTVAESFGVDWDVSESVTAAYVMGEYDIGDMTILGGVRYEQTDTDFSAYDLLFLDGDAETPVPVSGDNDYDHWLPSLHLRWAMTDDLLLRAAWTNTLGRPSYEVLAPFRIFEIDEDEDDPGIYEGEAEAGNPDLVPLEAMNFDIALEWYLQSGGILAAGIFYKDIENPIFTRITELEDEPFEGRDFSELVLVTTDNAESGDIFGIELNYQQQFVMLPGFFGGFGVALNYTYTDSEADVFGRDESVPFFLQSEHVGNASLFYERAGFEARIAYTYYSTYLDALGDDESQDLYFDDRGQLDFKASYQFSEHFNAFVQFLNMTDEPLRMFSGRQSGRLAENEIYSWNAMAGFQVKF